MSSFFCLSVTLIDSAFHGCSDNSVPEWPPSPLRAFQALVAAAAARWREPQFRTDAAPALRWLEGLAPPEIVGPAGQTAPLPYRLYVPNNAGDLVAKSWAGGNTDASIAGHRTEKDVRPTRLVGGDAFKGGNTVRFLWRLATSPSEGVSDFIAFLSATARSLTHLGWGIDIAAGHAGLLSEADVCKLSADQLLERWVPGSGGTPLRVPQAESVQQQSTFCSLVRRHDAFTRRMSGGKPQDVPPLTAFSVVGYRRATDPPSRPFVAFEIWKPLHQIAELRSGQSKFRPFDTAHRAVTVAGMVRCATAQAVEGRYDWNQERINTFIHGHTPDGSKPASGEGADQRLAFLPLPTISPLRVESIRRVLVTAPPGDEATLTTIRQVLSGCELFALGQPEAVAMLSLLPNSDRNLPNYVGRSAVWSTVTPVVLPGRFDNGNGRIQRQLRQTMKHAGWPEELARMAEFEWRDVGFRPGVDLARRYHVPCPQDKLPRYHVRVRFPVTVQGPLVLGAMRYRGLGLFAVER